MVFLVRHLPCVATTYAVATGYLAGTAVFHGRHARAVEVVLGREPEAMLLMTASGCGYLYRPISERGNSLYKEGRRWVR